MNLLQRYTALDCVKQLRNKRLSQKAREDLLSFLEQLIRASKPNPTRRKAK